MSIKNKKINIFFSILSIFIFYLVLAFFTPFTSDDWVWGSEVGIERLNNFFSNYNGRYLGNLTILMVTQILPLRSFFMAVVNTVIIILLVKLVWNKLKCSYLYIAFIFVMSMPLSIFSQTYGWSSGFANYNMSTLIILINFYFFRDIIYNYSRNNKNNIIVIIAGFVFGLIGQLYAEHVTIFNLLFGIGILIATIILKREFLRALSFVIGSILGTVLMFSNEAYRSVVAGQDTYRTIDQSTNLFEKLYTIFTTYMYKQLIYNNTVINLVILALLISILIFSMKKNNVLKKFFIFYLTIFPLYKLVVYDLMEVTIHSNIINILNSIFSLVYILVIGFSILLFVNFEKSQLIIYICSFAVVASPLFFVTPLSPRVFLASYILLVLLGLSLLKNIEVNNVFMFKIEYINILTSVVILFMGTYLLIFGHNYCSFEYRSQYIQENIEKGETEIKFWRMPHEQFIYESTPNPNGYMEKNFRRYYDVPKEVQFIREN